MAVQIEGQVGGPLVSYSDGADPVARMGRSGEWATSDLMPRLYELAKRGNVYVATSPAIGSGNMVAANVSPLAAGTGLPLVGIYNPPSSSVDLVIIRAWAGTVSGTPGGAVVWNVIPPNAGITAAGAPGLGARSFTPGGQGRAFVNSALTGSLVATMLRPMKRVSAVAAAGGEDICVEETAGDIIVPPGGFAGLAVAAVGTTHVLVAGIEWAELPI